MAIKGKKKSQTRGSQARRRPAPAPRPAVTGRAREPWYRTGTGRMAVVVVVVVLISLVAGVLVNASSDEGLEARRDSLEKFTDQVRDLRAQITDAASQMAGAPLSPRVEGFDELRANARQWSLLMGQAIGIASSLQTPASLTSGGELLSQAVKTYAAAAQTFEAAMTVEEDAQPRLLALAAGEREQALEMWNAGLAALEKERSDAGLEPSGLQPPAPAGAAPPPGTSPTGQGTGGGGNGGKGGDKKGSKEDGKGN